MKNSLKNILQKIYDFLIKSFEITHNENYINEYITYMPNLRPRL